MSDVGRMESKASRISMASGRTLHDLDDGMSDGLRYSLFYSRWASSIRTGEHAGLGDNHFFTNNSTLSAVSTILRPYIHAPLIVRQSTSLAKIFAMSGSLIAQLTTDSVEDKREQPWKAFVAEPKTTPEQGLAEMVKVGGPINIMTNFL